jgi:biotin operon repressor
MARGGRKPRVTDEDILALFDETTDPVLSTAEIADALPIGRRGVLDRLHNLNDDGKLEHKNIGGRNIVWWRTDENDIATSGSSEPVERTAEPRREPSGVDAEEPPAEDAFADIDFPQGRDRTECIDAIHAARDYLRENDKATMRDFVTDVMPDHPVGYDVPQLEPGDRYRGAWWRRVVKPGLKALPDVQSPASGQSEFRYVG